jgi:hypothetical protein
MDYTIKPYFIPVQNNRGFNEAEAKQICYENHKKGYDTQVIVYGETMLASDIWRFD